MNNEEQQHRGKSTDGPCPYSLITTTRSPMGWSVFFLFLSIFWAFGEGGREDDDDDDASSSSLSFLLLLLHYYPFLPFSPRAGCWNFPQCG